MFVNDEEKTRYYHLKKGNKWRYTKNSRQAHSWEQEGYVCQYKPGDDVAVLREDHKTVETVEQFFDEVSNTVDPNTERENKIEATASINLKRKRKARR